MDDNLLVNFHCHSIFSDGNLTPELLAENMALAGVSFASLTDHDTLEGLPRFAHALKTHSIAFLSGVEITTSYNDQEAHLLGYGFDIAHAELNATLLALRQTRPQEVHSIAGSIRKSSNNISILLNSTSNVSAISEGMLNIKDAIELIHEAGGFAFLAHPLYFERDMVSLDRIIYDLKLIGLDGIEAVYAPFTSSEQNDLRKIAQKHNLLICAGTDYHGINGLGSRDFGIKMRNDDWIRFRDKMFESSLLTIKSDENNQSTATKDSKEIKKLFHKQLKERSYVPRILIPTLLAIILFFVVIWGYILPTFETSLLEKKRELIRELTNSAWSILASYHQDEIDGLISREQAQQLAVERVEALRYGNDLKDYFWIQDMQPVMIMHPYRPELNGEDLGGFKDTRGALIFVEFANLVMRKGEGYIDYVWQWNDDPERLEPKESFVKGFEPWGWIIGTGIYTDDVNEEITRIERNIITTTAIISAVIITLLIFVLQQSLQVERQRRRVVKDLRESTKKYHALADAATDGMLLVLRDRLRYANPTLLGMLGYSELQMEFMNLNEILPDEDFNAQIWHIIFDKNNNKSKISTAIEGYLKKADGELMPALITINPINFESEEGLIILCKDIASLSPTGRSEGFADIGRSAPVGLFRANLGKQAQLLELNQNARTLLSDNLEDGNNVFLLRDLFPDSDSFEHFYQQLLLEKSIQNYVFRITKKDAVVRWLSISATLSEKESTGTQMIIGALEDVTHKQKVEADHAAVIEKLQSSLLFLHEPISSLKREIVTCSLETTILQLSRLMTTKNISAAVILEESGEAIGIVTDHDLRARVLADGYGVNDPVFKIMSAPISKIKKSALIYEALMMMEEKSVSHLAVEDINGRIINILDSKALIQFQSYGPIVLGREIMSAKTIESIADSTLRLPMLVNSLIESSAHTRHVTNMLASICDSATARIIQLMIEEIGPPPARFAFMAMGSQGRQEQTLLTDQDNGIVYDSEGNLADEDLQAYFLLLGEKVCESLALIGYSRCRGDVMARNPFWCRSLIDWNASLEAWVERSEPKEIMALSIFFDARSIYGDTELITKLRNQMHQVIASVPAYFHHAALRALDFKAPFHLVGNIYFGGGDTEHSGEINLKDAMMPVVSFARLYALRNQLNETHTLDRIDALVERSIITSSSRDDIKTAYDFLMRLRLQGQLARIQSDLPARNTIQLSSLGYFEKEFLKQAFAQISAVQKKINYDFLGGVY